MGSVMLLMLPFCGALTSNNQAAGDGRTLADASAVLLALALAVLQLLATVHEIAADSWGKSYVHHK